jgi:aminopeptidase YwaD
LRTAQMMERDAAASASFGEYERGVLNSVGAYFSTAVPANRQRPGARDGTPLFRRRAEPRGPLVVFGYDYFAAHAKAAGIPTPRLLAYEGSWGSGEEYAYEALNFANGTRSARQITAALGTEYGSVPEELVVEYLQALRKIGLLE